MQLYIINPESLEELDKFQAEDWVEAVQFVEINKAKYLEKNLTHVIISNKKTKLVCIWQFTSKENKSILKDKLFALPKKKNAF